MKTSCWPDWLDDLWAKSPGKGELGQPESLASHTWYVLSRLTELIRLRPDLPQTLGVPRLWQILFWAAFLHDFGKAATGFQARLHGGKRWPHRHEVLSLAFLDWLAPGLTADEQTWLTAAIVSHHKDASEIQRLYPSPDDPAEDPLISLISELKGEAVRGLWRWLHQCAAIWIEDLGLTAMGVEPLPLPNQREAIAMIRTQGIEHIRRRLRDYRRFVRRLEHSENRTLVIGTLILRGYLINADHSASAHAGPLPRLSFTAATVLQSRHLTRLKLFEHQRHAAETAGSALLTAPTGSGKTEAALLWASRQTFVEKALPRLFYALPYQASMNAMKLRLAGTFGEKMVGLQHGRSLLAIYRFLLENDYAPEEAARRARWARNLVQLNYPPVRVLSPYQILKSLYQLKGYEALLSDYYGAAFVLDEIHAYDVKRLALILKTVAFLQTNFDARFLVMSATFPTLIKRWLREALTAPTEISADQALFDAFERHRLRLLEGELLAEAGLARIVADAQAGKSVLVVCNIVARAQTVYQELRARLAGQDVPVILLHGRFHMRDRLQKERLVREAAGSTSEKRQPVVLVATQVVEVSLDIDLDTIYSEPAPLEALVQRFGRVNRRGRQAGLAPVHVFSQPDDGQKIYDPALLAGTLAILRRENGRPVNESRIGGWLDEIYSGEIARRWQAEYDQAAADFEDTCIRPLRAFAANESLQTLFYKAFDSVEVLPEPLYDAYENLRETTPIQANELLVPISWGRYHALAGQGRVLPREKWGPYIVRAAYDSEIGLTFDEISDDEDDW